LICLEEDEIDAEEAARLQDIKERDELDQRIKQRDLEKTKKVGRVTTLDVTMLELFIEQHHG
jgi:hypothetical protein